MDRDEMLEKNRRLTKNIKGYDPSFQQKRFKNVFDTKGELNSKRCIICGNIEPIDLFIVNKLVTARCKYCRETKICSICGVTKNLRRFPNKGKYNYCFVCEPPKSYDTHGMFINNQIEECKGQKDVLSSEKNLNNENNHKSKNRSEKSSVIIAIVILFIALILLLLSKHYMELHI